MRKQYLNISGERLVIDCLTYTVHMEPNTTLTLPVSRDIRLNVKLRKLLPVREMREERQIKTRFSKRTVKKVWKEKMKTENKEKQEKMETE